MIQRDKDKVYTSGVSANQRMLKSGKDSGGQTGSSRQSWNSKTEYLLAMVGNAVGIGNIWRFPYQCQKHGGGAFLIPYFIVLLLIGYPLLLMETALGQKYQSGAVAMWGQVSPYASGIGLCSLIAVCFLTTYYVVVLSWSFVYAANSFKSPLPWKDCPTFQNQTVGDLPVEECAASSPTIYYWFRTTLNQPNTIEESDGTINWQILLSVFVSCLLLFISLQKGVKSTGKFMYFAVLLPYLVLTVFLVRALTLDGSFYGIAYLLRADMTKLASVDVWQAAITQIFLGIGIGFGAYVAQASYMPRGNNCKWDVLFVASVNSLTSIIATLIVFAVLGFRALINQDKCLQNLAFTNNITVHELTSPSNNVINTTSCLRDHFLDELTGGTGLAFIAFAEAILSFPLPNMWSVIFFLMLGSVGLSSTIGILTGVIASLRDIGCRIKKSTMAAFLCSGLFGCTVLFTFDFGPYIIDMMDNNIAGLTLSPVVLFEVVATAHLLGINKFLEETKRMTGQSFGPYWKWTLAFFCPLLLTLVIAGGYVNYGIKGPLHYLAWSSMERREVEVAYPGWGYALVVVISLLSLIAIPASALLYRLGIFDLAAYLHRHQMREVEERELSEMYRQSVVLT